jgi:hypothetical protein
MIQKIMMIFLCLFSFASLTASANAATYKTHSACPQAHIGEPAFCANFKAAATCNCINQGGFGPDVCSTVPDIVKILTDLQIGIEGSCYIQSDDTLQDCMDKWNAYNSSCESIY